MKANAHKTATPSSKAAANSIQKKERENSGSINDKRPEAIAENDLSAAISNAAPIQTKRNDTGLPDNLKSGIENLSGHSMDDVKVHYNSSKPSQLNAHTYAQGTQIHLAPGQHQHLPHEAWHVAQQKQGRVQPTTEVNGASVNDDARLESEADAMGAKALQMQAIDSEGLVSSKPSDIVQRVTWIWNGESWYTSEETTNPAPTHTGKYKFDTFDDEAVEDASDHESDDDGKEEEVEDTSVKNPQYRPTTGGMSETDAAIIADLNDWDDASKEWRCSDSGHTPKGKVYKGGSNYYGADNTGHVGWGFKVWTKKNHTTLDYAGNTVWDGTAWKHIARGT